MLRGNMVINVTEEMEINTAILAELMELRNKKNVFYPIVSACDMPV